MIDLDRPTPEAIALLERYAPKAAAVQVGIRGFGDLEELEAEARLAIAQALRHWKAAKGRFGPYAHRRIRGRLANWFRKHGPVTRAGVRRPVQAELSPEQPAPTLDPTDRIVLAEAVKRGGMAAQAVWSVHVLGSTFPELANALGCSPSCAHRLYRRGLAWLRSELAEAFAP